MLVDGPSLPFYGNDEAFFIDILFGTCFIAYHPLYEEA